MVFSESRWLAYLPMCVNLCFCSCDVARYVSAQPLDFLDLEQKSTFLDWKHYLVPSLSYNRFMDGH